jgi:molybdopterin-guanine dinucleotide biosynthesis protein A
LDGGPLVGLAAALRWTRDDKAARKAVMTVPVDVPFIPSDLIQRLAAAGGLAVAESASRIHHAIALWPVALAPDVERAVVEGEFTLHRFQDRHGAGRVGWRAEPFDPFFNINTADDLRAAERIATLAGEHTPRRFA